jgi:hypothetical protein
LNPRPDCRICRWVPSPQSIRKRNSSWMITWLDRPRWTEGADADVPRKTISNKRTSILGIMSGMALEFYLISQINAPEVVERPFML